MPYLQAQSGPKVRKAFALDLPKKDCSSAFCPAFSEDTGKPDSVLSCGKGVQVRWLQVRAQGLIRVFDDILEDL